MKEEIIRYWDLMTELGIATDGEIRLAVALCGLDIRTMESILYIQTGYRDIDQYLNR